MTTNSATNNTNNASETNDKKSNSNQQENNKDKNELETHETANEDEYIECGVVDAWDEEEKDKPRRRSWDRVRGRDKKPSRERERDRDKDRDRDRDRRRKSRSNGKKSRSRGRRSRSHDKKRSRSAERRREISRRDPNKSSKDIELDKMRAKRDIDSKMLAEKEKAIKTLLDSDDVVPPGTEGEAIQNIVEKSQQEVEDKSERPSRDRRRSPVRNRLGPRRSPRRSPLRFSPDRRRSPIVFRRRSDSVEERREARRRLREREARLARRSRSRDRRSADRQRSRSIDRRRSRSPDRRRRISRSPMDRLRFRRRTISRSPVRSPNRSRKRSPFLNELARQFQNESRPENVVPISPAGLMPNMGPGGQPPFIPPGGGPQMDPRLMPAGPGMLPMQQSVMPGIVPGPMDMMPMHPGGPGVMHPGGPPFMGYEGPPGPVSGMGFDPMGHAGPPLDYVRGPMIYNQANPVPIPHSIQPASPQPVPAPGQGAPLLLSNSLGASMQQFTVPGPKYSPSENIFKKREERMKTPEPPIISDFKLSSPFQQNEKTSLSSLLEASVSSKDGSGSTTTFKGFRQEVIRHCEKALRNLPAEDPRLKMTGRFFFDPARKGDVKDKSEQTSNSILLRKGRTEIHWDEEENQLAAKAAQQQKQSIFKSVITHQKICQTDEVTKECTSVQTEEKMMSDFCMQVELKDLMPPEEKKPPIDIDRRVRDNRWNLEDSRLSVEENRRPIDEIRHPIDEIRRPIDEIRHPVDEIRRPAEEIRRPTEDIRRPVEEIRRPAEEIRRPIEENNRLPDRMDWNMRETYDHSSQMRENEDVRWKLNSNSIRDRPVDIPWSRGFSPNRQALVSDHMHGHVSTMPSDNFSRGSGSIDLVRDRLDPMMEARERLEPRGRDLDMRDRDLDMREHGLMDLMRERERMMDSMRDDRRPGIMDFMGSRGAGIEEFAARRQQEPQRGMEDYQRRDNFPQRGGMDDYQARNMDDYDLRNNFSGGFNRGGMDHPMDRDRMDMDVRSGNSTMDNDDLEVIEERAFDMDKPWQARNAAGSMSLAQLNNARGGAGRGGNASMARSFRGRVGSFRNY